MEYRQELRACQLDDAWQSCVRCLCASGGDRECLVWARYGGLRFRVGEWILMSTMDFAKIWEFMNIGSRCARAEEMTRAKLARASTSSTCHSPRSLG